MITYRSDSDRPITAASGGSPASTRSCSPVAKVVASRLSSPLASPSRTRLSTKASGRPSSSTATTATASVETSRRRCTVQPPSWLSVTTLKPESDPADRGDEARVVRVVPEFAAQPRDMHIEGLRGPPPFAVPDLPHDLLAGDHLARLGQQQREQVELLGGQL